MVQTMQLILAIPPVAVHVVVDVPVVQLHGLLLCCRSDNFQLLVSTAGSGVDFLGRCTQVQGQEPCPQN